jgi:phosphohistidine phosphatase
MDLLLIRHAAAAPPRPDLPDTDRPLTSRGRRRFRRSTRGLRTLGLRIDRLLHGPAVRSAATAALLEPLVEGETRMTDLVARSPSPALLAMLGDGCVALVGHEPWLSELLALLTNGGQTPTRVKWKKGGVAWLSGDPRPTGMELRAFFPPRLLRDIGRSR